MSTEAAFIYSALVGIAASFLFLLLFYKVLRPFFCPTWEARAAKRALLEETDPDNVWCCATRPADYKESIHLETLSARKVDELFVKSGVIEDISIVVAIDMTVSNNFKGRRTFGGRPLHQIDGNAAVDKKTLTCRAGLLNPYEQSILAAEYFLQTDEDFPLYYYGSTEAANAGGYLHVKDCHNVYELWETYHETASTQELAGPGRLTPVLERTIERTQQLNRFHVLFVLTDGDVEDEAEFGAALAQMSHDTPLAVVIVGIGDGPFHQAEKFDDHDHDDKLFDNLNFVHFKEITKQMSGESMKKEFFSLAFNEVPRQYTACKELLQYRAPARRIKHFDEPLSMSDPVFYSKILGVIENAAVERPHDTSRPTSGVVAGKKKKKKKKTKFQLARERRMKAALAWEDKEKQRVERNKKNWELKYKKIQEEKKKRESPYSQPRNKQSPSFSYKGNQGNNSPSYPQQQGYPQQQQGYPQQQQGYPPQQQGYPPQQQGYPPQQQGYPPQQQGYPQGYGPQQGYPQAQQGYVQQPHQHPPVKKAHSDVLEAIRRDKMKNANRHADKKKEIKVAVRHEDEKLSEPDSDSQGGGAGEVFPASFSHEPAAQQAYPQGYQQGHPQQGYPQQGYQQNYPQPQQSPGPDGFYYQDPNQQPQQQQQPYYPPAPVPPQQYAQPQSFPPPLAPPVPQAGPGNPYGQEPKEKDARKVKKVASKKKLVKSKTPKRK